MVKVLRLENTRLGAYTTQPELVDKIIEFSPEDGTLRVHVLREPSPIPLSAGVVFAQRALSDNTDPVRVRVIHNFPVPDAYSAPFKLYLDITTACPLRCPFCLQAGDGSEAMLPLNTITKVAEELSELGVMYIKIGGGDPFLHPQFPEALALIRSAGCFITISTNSVTLTHAIADLLAENSVQVSVSIEGLEETNNDLRGVGHFKMAMRALEILKSAGAKTLLRVTLLRQNLAEIPALVEIAHARGVRIKFAYCRPAGRAVTNQAPIGPADRDNYMRAIRYLNQPAVLTQVLLDEGMMAQQPAEIVDKLFRGRMCGAANRSMHINAHGKISPCVFLGPVFSQGTIYQDGSLADFWRGKVGTKFRAVRSIRQPEQCDGCERICKNECIANRFYFWGDFAKQDPNCLRFVSPYNPADQRLREEE